MQEKEIWIEDNPEEGVFLFTIIREYPNIRDYPKFEGRLVYIISSIIGQLPIGIKCPFRKDLSRKLEEWEIIKYKLLGYL